MDLIQESIPRNAMLKYKEICTNILFQSCANNLVKIKMTTKP